MQKTLSIAFERTLYSPRYKSTLRITESFICISQEPMALQEMGSCFSRWDEEKDGVNRFSWLTCGMYMRKPDYKGDKYRLSAVEGRVRLAIQFI